MATPYTTMNTRLGPVAFLLAIVLAAPACAYDYPLSPEAVREAYFFGRSSDGGKVMEFLGRYMHRFPSENRKVSPGIIELRTPYERIVKKSRDDQVNYSAQQAAIDYAAQANTVEVIVYFGFYNDDANTAELYKDNQGHILDRRENFWRDYKFRVTQEKVIEPKKVEGTPRYSSRGRGLSGANVRLELDTNALTASKLRVEVISLDGKTTATADFVLDQLK